MKKLAIITTHPIQYNAPLFALISKRNNIKIHVFYTYPQAAKTVKDKDFGRDIEWDIPLLKNYDYSFVENNAQNPSLHHFNGIDNHNLISDIETWQADAILVFGWNYKSHLKCLGYFKDKIPVLFRGDSTLLDEKAGLGTLIRRLWLRYVFRFVDIALYTGTNNKYYFLKHGLKKSELVFAPHAIDNNRFADFDSTKLKELKQSFGIEIKTQQIPIVFAGKFDNKKNPELIIRAIQQFNEQDFYLIMVGSGRLESKLKKMSHDMKNIKFIPFQNQQNMPLVYRMGKVFVLPSKGPAETWGLAVNEAMACGRTILVSNKCGCAIDLVDDNENGYIFQSKNIENLTEKLNMLIDQKHKLNNFGRYSQKKIKAWSYTHIATAIENTINNIR